MLFHFSENPDIARFDPRRPQTPRANGPDWLNGPLVWAISEAYAFLYLFPRDCPRIVIWETPQTTARDSADWLRGARRAAYVEDRWMDRIRTTAVCRYTLPSAGFEPLDDIGMFVSRLPVEPVAIDRLIDLPQHLKNQYVDVRPVRSLTPIHHVWTTSLHASGIRLRNAR